MRRWVAMVIALAACGPPPEAQDEIDAAADAVDAENPDADMPCAGGCDDGHPCTADSCVDDECVHLVLGTDEVCRPSTGVCDGAEVCDGLDFDCPVDFSAMACANATCIAPSDWCDGVAECSDMSDEGTTCAGVCNGGAVACGDGACVTGGVPCDGEALCADRGDESAAVCGGVCTGGAFACASGACVPGIWECDGVPDCGDASDEHC